MKCWCSLLQTVRQALQDVHGISIQISLKRHLILVLATLTCSSSGWGRSWFPKGFICSGSCGMSCDVLVTMVKKMSFSCKRNDFALLLNGGSANVLSEKSRENSSCRGMRGTPRRHLSSGAAFGLSETQTNYKAEKWGAYVYCTTWC